jgi:hypothetical protein
MFGFSEKCPRLYGYVYSQIFNACYKFHELDPSLEVPDYNSVCVSEGAECIKIDSQEKQQHIVLFLGK